MPGNSCSSDLEQEIEILNFSESDIVKHPILLLKARLSKKLFNNKCELIINCKETTTIEYLVTHISQRGIFKILLNLNELFIDNSIELANFTLQLQYGLTTKTLNIKYETTAQLNYYKVQPLLILCNDHSKDEQEQHLQQSDIIDLNLQLVQCVYADRLNASGLGRSTFQINGKCVKHKINLQKTQLWKLTKQEIWQHVASDLLNSTQNQANIKFVAFIASTKYVTTTTNYELLGHVALGAGGLALFSAAYFYAWPQKFQQILACFASTQTVDWQHLPDESNFRRTYGGVYASTLGAVCHELGHIFDLGHTQEGVMGSGFDYLNRLFTVDTPTEALPQRQVNHSTQTKVSKNVRLTKIQPQNSNKFLEKYHSQQIADEQEFYFTRNCALILSTHKWLSDLNAESNENELILTNEHIYLHNLELKCSLPIKVKLLEVRRNEDGFVLWFHEFPLGAYLSSFVLPNTAGFECSSTHLMLLTYCGVIKRIQASNQI